MKPWNVYILRCSDDSLYTGVAKDVERRVEEHNSDNRLGARYTRGRRPVTLVYREGFDNRSEACRRESEIKQLSRTEKQQLIANGEN
jgi:putative endonuclease